MIGTTSDQLTEDLLSHEAIQIIVKGGLRETWISRKYEKMGYGGVGADLVPGHWPIRIEPVTWSIADLRQGTPPEQVERSNC